MIPTQRGHALYHQLADVLRDQIGRGEYGPGSPLPKERELARLHGVGLMTVRRALGVLREEGLISTARGKGAAVRVGPKRAEVIFRAGSRLIARMPSAGERAAMRLDPGVPLLEIQYADGRVELLAADQTEVIGRAGQPPQPTLHSGGCHPRTAPPE